MARISTAQTRKGVHATTQLSDPGCEWDRHELLELGESIVAAAPEALPLFQRWLSAVRGLSDEACTSFSVEAALTSLTMELRRHWLRFAHDKADEAIKSPLRVNTMHESALGAPIAFGYERSIQPNLLEDRCFATAPAPRGWTVDHVLFSSAQAGLSAVLHFARGNGFWDANAPHLKFAGNYFESQQILNIFAQGGLNWSRDKSISAVHAGDAGASRTMMIEPVFYDQAANVFEIGAFHRAWNRYAATPSLLVLDTTLTGPLFPVSDLLEPLGGEQAPIVINFRSGLKLDQAGLELVNVGVVSIYRHRGTLAANAVDVGAQLRNFRIVLGAGLTLDEISTLEAPWFLNKDYFRRYSASVFENNARLADELLMHNHMFSQVLHPRFARPNCAWANAPYTLLRLHDEDPNQYRFLERVLSYEAEKRGLQFDLGGSFGFRGHRFEAVIPEAGMGSPYLRVAMGARSGPSWRGIVKLLSEIVALPDFRSLIERYEIQHASATSHRGMNS